MNREAALRAVLERFGESNVIGIPTKVDHALDHFGESKADGSNPCSGVRAVCSLQ